MNIHPGAGEPCLNSNADGSVTSNQNTAEPTLHLPLKAPVKFGGGLQEGESQTKFSDLDPALRAELLAVPGTGQVLLHPSARVTYVTKWQVNVKLFGMTRVILRLEEDPK
jgi:hypothetical protein